MIPDTQNPESGAPQQNSAGPASDSPARRKEKLAQDPTGFDGMEHGHDDSDLQSEIDMFDQLLDQHLPGAEETAPRGEVIEVAVVAVREDSVLVDFGGKAEAFVPITDFPQIDGKPNVKEGQIIRVVQMSGRTGEGAPRLSHREARVREAEAAIKAAQEANQPLEGLVTQIVKGGLMVDIGLQGFMPASQVDLFKIPDLSSLVGKPIKAYVIEYDPRRKRAVLSRRRLLIEQREGQRQQFLQGLQPGQEIEGKVKNTVDFGAFVDLGIIDGFIPREEISYDRGTPPGDVLRKGESIKLKILKIDPATGKITLSRKRLTPDPWEKIEEKYPIGSIVQGEVIAIQSYGAFVHLEEGVTGMIHATDMSWAPGNKKPSDFVSMGQEVTSQILEIDREKRRMSLGLKQVMGDPWEGIKDKFPIGSTVKGTVTSLTNYGAFVKLDEYVEGMIHVSDLSWEKRVNHPKDHLKVNEEVEAKVLKIDGENRRISLGVKQLAESPFAKFRREHQEGSLVTGKVSRFAPFGAFVELENGIEGLIHISQIDEKRVELPEKALQVGQEVTCKIVKVDVKKQKISLSRKDAIKAAERETVREYMRKGQQQTANTSLGDMISKLRRNDDENE